MRRPACDVSHSLVGTCVVSCEQLIIVQRDPAQRDPYTDEIVRPPVIDKPMCDHLFNADLLIADPWMSNADAIHEPGARLLGHP
jgi:hypothetical protein